MPKDRELCDFISGAGQRLQVDMFPRAPLVSLRVGSGKAKRTYVLDEKDVAILRDAFVEFLELLDEEHAEASA